MFERAWKITRLGAATRACRATLALSAMLLAAPAWAQTPGVVPPVDDSATVLHLVERIRDLQVGNADGTQPVPRPLFMQARAAASAPVAEPGDATVSVSVSAEVLLTPRR